MWTRRQFIKAGAMAGAALMVPGRWIRRAAAAIPGGSLDPVLIPKFVTPLVIPPAMPRTAVLGGTDGRIVQTAKARTGAAAVVGGTSRRGNAAANLVEYYEIGVRQFSQQILPAGLPSTLVWGYGSLSSPATFHYPSFTIEAKWQQPVRVRWVNQLVDAQGKYLPHLLDVDPTLHWANPPGGMEGRDQRPTFDVTPGPYTGPVPMVTHVHGAHTHEESDGFAEAWYLPDASNVPSGYAREGSRYAAFAQKFAGRHGVNWAPGSATFQYPNDQRATTLWYHDHTLGMTRLNVYAGPAGFYLVRGGPDDEVKDRRTGKSAVLPGPAPDQGKSPGIQYQEIPLAIQDRSFNADGSLFYPDSREFFDGYPGPFVPGSDLSPIWNPEFFGNAMVVNGRAWPYLEVQQRRYRFRLLNGCNSRFLILRTDPILTFWQIGAEGGFLAEPVPLTELLMSPAERADVIVDFGQFPVGAVITLMNVGPDEPFGGGVPGSDFPISDPLTTGQVMQFRVVPRLGKDITTAPGDLVLPALAEQRSATVTRQLSLNEMMSESGFDGPAEALLGTVDGGGNGVSKLWMDEVTENPDLGATEIWEFHNFTEDAHPIHVHQVMFEVVNRQPIGEAARPPEAWESGPKDTVIAYPGEITRIRATFDLPGRYVWHCHIVEHEDNEMMRPYHVGPIDGGGEMKP